jgi:hypothetical protein
MTSGMQDLLECVRGGAEIDHDGKRLTAVDVLEAARRRLRHGERRERIGP